MALRLDHKVRLLAALPVFAAMEPAAVHVLAFTLTERALAPGEHLFAAGEKSTGGFIVVSGSIRLESSTALIPHSAYGPGTLLGEAALVAETERPATAIAAEPTIVLVLPRDLVLQVLEQHPDSARQLRAYVEARVRATRTLIGSVA